MATEAIPVLEMPEPASVGGFVLVRIAMMSIYAPIRKAPTARDPLRPRRSMRARRKKRHEMTLTTPKKPLMRSLSSPAPTAVKI